MNARSLSDLKSRYEDILKEIKTVCSMDVRDEKLEEELGQFSLIKMVERSERVAHLHYELLVIRNEVRKRIDQAHYSGEDKRFRNEAAGFLAELKQDARTVSEISGLWTENVRAMKDIFRRLHSGF